MNILCNKASKPTEKLNFYYQNARGLRTKAHDFYLNLLNENFDAVFITETWLLDSINNCELFDSRYNVFRRDRSSSDCGKKRGGGVLVAIRNTYKADLIDVSCNVECIWLKVQFHGIFHLISCVYIPPDSPLCIYETYYEMLDSLIKDFKTNILIMGDFNIISEGNGRNHEKVCLLDYFTNYHRLKSVNTVKNCLNRTLDLIITDIKYLSICKCENPLVPEDNYHPALLVCYDIPPKIKPIATLSKQYDYDFKNANFALLYNELSE